MSSKAGASGPGAFARACALVVLAAALAVAGCGRADNASDAAGTTSPGVTARAIQLGASFPLSGPFAIYAPMAKGFNAYLEAVNADGGVNGRTVSFKALDDAYDPSRTAANARTLVQGDRKFALITLGGPANAIRQFMEQSRTPQLAMSGSSALNDTRTFHYTRAWYPDIVGEAAVDTRWILDNVENPKIGTLLVDNDAGADFTTGIRQALGTRQDVLVKSTTWDPTQVDVSSQINQLRAAGANAVITAVTGPAAVGMIRYIRQIRWDVPVFMFSATTSKAAVLSAAGLDNARGLMTAAWLKDPSDATWLRSPTLADYRSDVQRYGDGADADDQIVLTGYGAAAAFVAALETMQEPTQAGLIDAFDELAPTEIGALLPGIEARAATDGHLVSQYQVQRFDGSTWSALGDPVNVADALASR